MNRYERANWQYPKASTQTIARLCRCPRHAVRGRAEKDGVAAHARNPTQRAERRVADARDITKRAERVESRVADARTARRRRTRDANERPANHRESNRSATPHRGKATRLAPRAAAGPTPPAEPGP